MNSIGSELEKSTGPTAHKLELAGNIKAGANGMRTGQRGILLNALQNDAKGMDTTRKDYAVRRQKVADLIAELKPLLTTEKGREVTNTLEYNAGQHASYFNQIVELCAAGKLTEAQLLYKQHGAPAGAAMERAGTELMALVVAQMAESATAGATKKFRATWTAVAMAVVAFAVVFLLIWTQRQITSRLRNIAAEIGDGAQQIESATLQLASASQSLAQGASQQAASLEETSAGAHDVANSTRKNAESVKSAALVMLEVDVEVSQVNAALQEMLISMREIATASDGISKIMKVIDGIAFQTNILALNAAVEAARAGESGMGFAVVADEVRNLAQRSSQASKDTAGLIADSIAKSGQGGSRLRQVEQLIGSITGDARKVKMLVDEVNTGSQEEARGLEGIAKAISSMEAITQSAAGNAEQTASTSEEMAAQAKALHRIVHDLELMVGAKH